MAEPQRKTIQLEREPSRSSGVSYNDDYKSFPVSTSDPKMITISYHEIKSFLIIESCTKYLTLVGSLILGSVLSPLLSNEPINYAWCAIGIFVFIGGFIGDSVLVFRKLQELARLGEHR
jgi:hypothetical protein